MIWIAVLAGMFALAAALFAVWPLLRRGGGATPRRGLALAVGLTVFIVGMAAYWRQGAPDIARTALTGPSETDYPGLIARLALQMRDRPDDAQGWTLLARGYASLNMPGEAAKAYARVVDIARKRGALSAPLLSAYGEMLAAASDDVTPAAEAVFREALTLDPKAAEPRYYLGLAAAAKGKTQEALDIWQGVLADAPADAPYRQSVVDAVARLTAQAVGQGTAEAPDVGAMVASLATRLEQDPNDLAGWQRLVRAYSVLGDHTKAQAALSKARAIFASDADAISALAETARENNLQ